MALPSRGEEIVSPYTHGADSGRVSSKAPRKQSQRVSPRGWGRGEGQVEGILVLVTQEHRRFPDLKPHSCAVAGGQGGQGPQS